MRKGEVVLQNLVVQLVFMLAVGALIGGFVFSAVNMELFDQRVFSSDNVLLVESMFSVQDGTVEWAYPLTKTAFTVGVDDRGYFSVGADGQTASKRIMVDEDVDIIPARFTPLMYRWVKTPSTLTLGQLGFSASCPPLSEAVDWDGDLAVAVGPPVTTDILETGLIPRGVRVETAREPSDSAVTQLLAEQGESLSLIHSGEPLMNRLACLAAIELGNEGVVVDVMAADRSLPRNTLSLTFREDDEQGVRDGLSCAYRRLLDEEASCGS